MVKKIDHIAIAVHDLDSEIDRYQNILGLSLIHREIVEEQKVKVAVFAVGDVNIELLEPLSEDSPISSFLEKRGGGIHHVALEVDDINQQTQQMSKEGIKFINREPKKGIDNKLITFLHPENFSRVLLELVQKSD